MRNVKRQIKKALDRLGAESESHQRDASKDEAAPRDVRKRFKKVRAALRLVREDLGEDIYRKENWCFRDAGRLLREVRDAEVLVEAVDKLALQQAAEAVERGAFAKIRETLFANRPGSDPPRNRGRSIRCGGRSRHRALARLPDWRIERDGWAGLEGGLRRTYQIGHRALALAAANASTENLHEWRKQARHLWGQLQLLEAAWTGSEKERGDRTRDWCNCSVKITISPFFARRSPPIRSLTAAIAS